MNITHCIKNRRSIRNFNDKVISQEIFTDMIETASFSPSWKNSQTPRYIIIQDKTILASLANTAFANFANNGKIISRSSAVVLVTKINNRSGFERDGSFSTSKGNGWEMFDSGIATQTLCLAGYAHDIGSVILGIFDTAAIGSVVDIPANQEICAVVAMGYYDEHPAVPKRKSVDELVTFL